MASGRGSLRRRRKSSSLPARARSSADSASSAELAAYHWLSTNYWTAIEPGAGVCQVTVGCSYAASASLYIVVAGSGGGAGFVVVAAHY